MVVRRKRRNPKSNPPIPIEHTGFYPYVLRYYETLKIRQRSPETLRRHDSALRQFIAWCDERSIDDPKEVTKPILERYQRHLYYYRQSNGKTLSANTQGNYVSSLRQFFKWLTQENYLLYNPASELFIPKSTPRLPVVLTEEEIDHLLQQPDTTTPHGIRDRAILEVLYSTGVRRSELCRLALKDISLSRQTLYVREGKGGKDRLLPMGQRATDWLQQYIETIRPKFLLDLHEPALFLNDYGEPFRSTKLGDKVKRLMKQAGINVPGSCHLLRHAMATHMMENGADIRFIQAMLGHSDLSTTEIYTHVSIRKLQEVHTRTHPAKMESIEES